MSETQGKKTIQYDEGSDNLSLMDGQVAKRGEPITVDAELADQLLMSSVWYEPGKGSAEGAALAHDHQPETEEEIREQELADRPEPTDAAKEKAKEEGVDLDEVEGSGGREGDQVTVEDVKQAATETPAATVPSPPDTGSGESKKNRR